MIEEYDTKNQIKKYINRKREMLSSFLESDEIEVLTNDDLFDEEDFNLPEETEDKEPILFLTF